MFARPSWPGRLRRPLPPTLAILFAALLLLPVAPSSALPAPQQAARPNVVVIMADDLDSASVEQLLAAGKLPNIKEQIIDKGTTFANSFVTYALCCPSRTTFLTGQYPHNHKVYSNVRGRPKFSGGFDAFKTSEQERNSLPFWLKAAGYRTGHIGKYLNGYNDPSHVPLGWNEWQATFGGSTYLNYNYRFSEKIDDNPLNVTSPIPDTYQTYELASRASSFITRTNITSPDQPFFLMVTPLAPHIEGASSSTMFETQTYTDTWIWGITPPPDISGTLRQGYDPALPLGADKVNRPNLPLPGFDLPSLKLPSFNEGDVSDKPRWLREDGMKAGLAGWPTMTDRDTAYLRRQHLDRLESTIGLDRLVGQVTQALSGTGDLSNTLLIFTSDNGFLLGEHRLNEKFSAYEQSIRVPLFIRAPGQDTPRVEDRLVINTDIPATIDDYSAAGPSNGFQIDGRSLRPLLEGAPADLPWRKRFLVEFWFGGTRDTVEFWEVPDYAAVRTAPESGSEANQMYIEYDTNDDPASDDGRTTDAEHYLLDLDPYQVRSRHNDPAYERDRIILSAQLNSLRQCKGVATDDPQSISCREAEDLPDSFWGDCAVVGAAVTRPLYNAGGDPTTLRQVVFGGGAYWTRDSSSLAGDAWSAWLRYTFHNAWKDDTNHPPTDRVDAAVYLPVYSGAGSITAIRQLIYSGDRVWTRDSSDRFGTTWPTSWLSGTLTAAWGGSSAQGAPPSDRVDAVSFTPVYTVSGEQGALRQQVYRGEQVWTRDSSDRFGNSWPTGWLSDTLLAAWGNSPNPRPPITGVDTVDIVPVYRDGKLAALRQVVYGGGAAWSRESQGPNLEFTSVPTWTVASYAASWEGASEGSWYARPPLECSPLNAYDDTVATAEDTPVSFPLLANDTYRVLTATLSVGDSWTTSLSRTLSLSDVIAPSTGGALSLLPGGQLFYTPSLNYAGTQVLTYTLADDAGRVSSASATLVVTAANDAPALLGSPATLAIRGKPYSFTTAAADPDPGDVLTVTATVLPSWLTLSPTVSDTTGLSATAAFSGTAAVYATATLSGTTDIPGDYPVELQVSDRAGAVDIRRFTIAVRAQPLYLPLVQR